MNSLSNHNISHLSRVAAPKEQQFGPLVPGRQRLRDLRAHHVFDGPGYTSETLRRSTGDALLTVVS